MDGWTAGASTRRIHSKKQREVVNKIFKKKFIFYKLILFIDPQSTNYSVLAKLDAMPALRPCPVCRKPSTWEGNAWKPFCSERCRTLDLGAWSSETYRVTEKPEEEMGDGWDSESSPGGGPDL